jgi:transcriptional regulator
MDTIKLDKPIYLYSAREWMRIWVDARRAEIKRLRTQGQPLEKIGKYFGVSRQNIARLLKDE